MTFLQQMRTEEAVGGLKRKDQLRIIPQVEVLQDGHGPGGMMVVVTMTVGTVIHDLAVIHLVEEAYLPEDHAAITAHP